MDHSVIRAMARWPNVPAVYGWLSLDRRGRWCLQDRPVTHRGAIEFMNRNYGATEDGCWYFQNGPQRVFVDLDYTPWVLTVDGSSDLVQHTGEPVGSLRGAWLDEEGNLLLQGECGIGLLCDRDLESLSHGFRFADGRPCDEEGFARLVDGAAGAQSERIYLEWGASKIELKTIARGSVPEKFGFEPCPRADDNNAC